MRTTNLRRVGGSVMMAVPPAVLDLLDLRAGATVGLTVDDGHLVIQPQARPRYTLEDLLSQCDASADFTSDEREWLDNEPAGRELL